jgi:hypothetical protein
MIGDPESCLGGKGDGMGHTGEHVLFKARRGNACNESLVLGSIGCVKGLFAN